MYGSDFERSTAAWDLEPVGAYVRLLNHQWDAGSIPNDLRGIATILRVSPARAKKLWWIVESKFGSCGDGLLRNRRLAEIRAAREAFIAEQQRKAPLGGRARWNAHRHAQGDAIGHANGHSRGDARKHARDDAPPSSSSSGSDSVVPSPPAGLFEDSETQPLRIGPEPAARGGLGKAALKAIDDSAFDAFWEAYPKKKSKGQALKAWKKTARMRPSLAELLEKLSALRRSREWTKEGGEYVPYPATWLNAHGWDDEVRSGPSAERRPPVFRAEDEK